MALGEAAAAMLIASMASNALGSVQKSRDSNSEANQQKQLKLMDRTEPGFDNFGDELVKPEDQYNLKPLSLLSRRNVRYPQAR